MNSKKRIFVQDLTQKTVETIAPQVAIRIDIKQYPDESANLNGQSPHKNEIEKG
jgi:hypothetical protein